MFRVKRVIYVYCKDLPGGINFFLMAKEHLWITIRPCPMKVKKKNFKLSKILYQKFDKDLKF